MICYRAGDETGLGALNRKKREDHLSDFQAEVVSGFPGMCVPLDISD